MSRSYRKPYYVMSKPKDKDIANGQARAKIRAELNKPEPDINILEADTKELGLDDWGTKIAFEFPDTQEYAWAREEQIKAKRK